MAWHPPLHLLPPTMPVPVRRGDEQRPIVTALRVLSFWIERARQRRCLGSLPDRFLKDIGVSRCDALHEARKPFWRE